MRGDTTYQKIEPNDGVYRSHVFPGLWLDADAMIGDMKRALAVLQQGLATPEHVAFCEHLKQGTAE